MISFIEPKKGEEKDVLIKFISSSRLDGVSLTGINESDFTGTIIYYNSSGDPTKTVVYEDGIESKSMTNYTINNFVKYAPPNACINCYVLMHTSHWVDWYDGYTGQYMSSEYEYTSSEWVYVGPGNGNPIPDNPEPYHNHYDYPHGPAIGSYNHIIEILKDQTFLETKAECIYDILDSGSSTFKELIQKFDGEFPVSHLRFSMDDLDDGTRAETLPPQDYVIEIRFNNDQSVNGVNRRPNLLVAKTIIHETLHAEMWRKILSIIENGGDVGGLTKVEWNQKLSNGDFPGIFDYYARYGINHFQHPLMGNHYREIIADGLQEFDNHSHSRQFYLDIAWEGLRYSNISSWSDLPPEEKNRINAVISAYISQNQNQSCQ